MYKILILLLLTSCMKPCYQVQLQQYTEHEQQEVLKILKEQDNEILYKFFIDYYNLRSLLDK